MDVLISPRCFVISTACRPGGAAPDGLIQLISAELIRGLRGKRSQAAFSRRLGYKSNIVNRWEAGKAFPSASTFLQIVREPSRSSPRRSSASFRARRRSSLGRGDFRGGDLDGSPAAAAAFLRELRGKVPILTIAKESGLQSL